MPSTWLFIYLRTRTRHDRDECDEFYTLDDHFCCLCVSLCSSSLYAMLEVDESVGLFLDALNGRQKNI